MPTECSPGLFEFARVEGRAVVASFDGGRMTSDAGALLLGAADRVIGLTRKLAGCFADMRNPAFIEHDVETLLMQRVVGIALGYEDLNDHDELRHDPVLATLAGKLTARRDDCAPLACKIGSQRARALGARHAEPAGTRPRPADALCPAGGGYSRHREAVRRSFS
jgi:hypothetical protein